MWRTEREQHQEQRTPATCNVSIRLTAVFPHNTLSARFEIPGKQFAALLIILSSGNNCRAVDCLLRVGADKNKRNDTGETALHSCIGGIEEGSSSMEMLDLLLRSGCNTEIHGYLGATPLHQAIIFGLHDCVNLLLKYGANPYAVERDVLCGNETGSE